MLKKSISLLGLVLVGVVCASAQKVTHENELRAIYRKLDVALRTRDANKVTQYYDAKYTLESDGKQLNREETVSQWKEILGYIKSVAKLTTKIEKISVKDGVYAVEYSQTSSGKIQFPQSPVLPFTFNGKITDSWRRDKHGRWQTVASVEHVSDLKVKGETAKAPGN
jgi:pterin-4a-carbinolamine dehydratase